ncbi:hypothetical protein ACG02S_07415 [Roseateles sp. DC23W]|uniref:Uncharacterized protein n=1 Tax=Pelomonas dachongensis TaxID=3299029 RepID=A0ABW7EK28_9BURK
MRLEPRLIALCAVLWLAGCQAPPAAPPPLPAPVCPEPAAPPEAEQLNALLGQLEDLHKTLVLAQGRSPAEQLQASAQLDALALATNAQAEPLRPLAQLLNARLAEQRRLQDNVDKLTAQLRDSQRRNEQLNEKLEALKAIEQALPGKPATTGRAP